MRYEEMQKELSDKISCLSLSAMQKVDEYINSLTMRVKKENNNRSELIKFLENQRAWTNEEIQPILEAKKELNENWKIEEF